MLFELQRYNITLIDFNELFINEYSKDIFNNLQQYNLLEKNLNNSDVKRIFYHGLIYGICETALKPYKGKPVLLFNINKLNKTSLSEIYDNKLLIDFLITFVLKLEEMLPVKICRVTIDFKNLSQQYTDSQIPLVLNMCLAHCLQINNKKYTLQKIKVFTKKYGLTFLNNDYLQRLKTKHLLI
jgi:hypothetical protein